MGLAQQTLLLPLYAPSLLVSPPSPTWHDAMVVLGGGFSGKEQLSLHSRLRAELAARLYQQHPCPVLFSGGATHPASFLSEAKAMGEIAVALGISRHHVFLEEKSNNTWENAEFSVPLLQKQNFERVLLVSSPTHLLRSYFCFRRYGMVTRVFAKHFPFEHVALRHIFYEYGAWVRTLPELLR